MILPPLPQEKVREPTIVNGELIRTSVSGMQLFRTCPAKWVFKYRENLPEGPPGKGAERGKQGHARIEHYLKTGQNALDPLERLGIELGFIPPPGPDLSVEDEFNRESAIPLLADGVPLVGYIDLINPRFLRATGVLWVTDWKFKRSIRDYGCKAEDLINPDHEAGIQMLGYAAWIAAMRARFPGLNLIRLAHVTFQTQGKRDVQEVFKEITLTRAIELWETVSRSLIPDMRVTARESDVHKVRKVESACFKYHKACDFMGACNNRAGRLAAGFAAARQVSAVRKDDEMGMLKQMTNGASTAVQPPPPPAAQPTPPARKLAIQDETTKPAAKPTVVTLAGNAVQGNAYLVDGQDGVFLCNTSIAGTQYSSFRSKAGGIISVSPDLAITPAEVAPAVESTPEPIQIATPEPIQIATPEVAPPPVAVAVEAPKRARRTKAEMEAARAESESAPVSSTPIVKTDSDSSSKSSTPETAPAPAPSGGVYLYFGCSPVGVACASLAPYVAELDRKLREAANLEIPDLRAAEGNQFGFGKWKAYLAGVALESPPPAGHYLVTSGDERIQCVAEALAGVAAPGHVVIGGGR